MIDVELLDMAAAVALTLALTEFAKRALGHWVEHASKLAPLLALLAAAVVVGALIEVTEATQQDYVLAVIIVTLTAVGGYSGVKSVGQGISAKARRV